MPVPLWGRYEGIVEADATLATAVERALETQHDLHTAQACDDADAATAALEQVVEKSGGLASKSLTLRAVAVLGDCVSRRKVRQADEIIRAAWHNRDLLVAALASHGQEASEQLRIQAVERTKLFDNAQEELSGALAKEQSSALRETLSLYGPILEPALMENATTTLARLEAAVEDAIPS